MILTIFGYPKTGKTLLFNLLTDKDEEVSKFSTSTDEYHKAVVDVPDERLKLLSEHFNLPPVYARIEYLDAGAISFGEVTEFAFSAAPSPNAENNNITKGFAQAPRLSHQRGFYDAGFVLTMEAGTPSSTIYYTLDGTEPTPTNPQAQVYTNPISVETTAIIRSVTYADDYLRSAIETHTFVFPTDVAKHETKHY